MRRTIFVCLCSRALLSCILVALAQTGIRALPSSQHSRPASLILGRRPGRSTGASTSRSGRPSRPSPPSPSRIRSRARPPARRPKCAIMVGKGQVYIGIICFDSDPSKIIVVAGAPRRVVERHRLGRHGARHLQRQPERVRVRHQPARHRIRRPGGARRADERRLVGGRAAAAAAHSAAASARSIPTGMATGR